MSTIWLDGFDHYSDIADLSRRYVANVYILNTSAGRWGGGAVFLRDSASPNCRLNAPLATSPSEIWMGVSIQLADNGSPNDQTICSFVSPNGIECYVTYNSVTLLFKLYKGDGSGIIATSSPVILGIGPWHFLDFHLKLGLTTTGVFEIWVDNTSKMNATGIATQISGSGGGTLVVAALGMASGGGTTSYDAYYDDLTIHDTLGSQNNGRVCDSRICSSVPNADASPNNGTPSTTGAHYLMVNEAQFSSANTITLANTTGQAEQFDIIALPINPAQVYAVQVIAIAEKTDGGAAAAKLCIDSATNIVKGSAQNLLDPYGFLAQVFEVDPATSVPFTYTGVNNLQIRYEVA